TVIEYNRRSVVAMSVGGLAALSVPSSLAVAAQCVSGALPSFLPNSLTVDCASGRNFRTFRQYSDYLGLAGVVSMTTVRGKYGGYRAGTLFLFPWLRPKGEGRALPAVLPTNATAFVNASTIPDGKLPVDEYFCRYTLQAPWNAFIGFQLDKPFSPSAGQLAWFSHVCKIAEGVGVGGGWTSADVSHTTVICSC